MTILFFVLVFSSEKQSVNEPKVVSIKRYTVYVKYISINKEMANFFWFKGER